MEEIGTKSQNFFDVKLVWGKPPPAIGIPLAIYLLANQNSPEVHARSLPGFMSLHRLSRYPRRPPLRADRTFDYTPQQSRITSTPERGEAAPNQVNQSLGYVKSLARALDHPCSSVLLQFQIIMRFWFNVPSEALNLQYHHST